MKLFNKRIIPSVVVTVSMILLLSQNVKSTLNDTIYIGQYQLFDTVAICSSFDSIMVVPPEGLHNIFWFVDDVDTLYVDTLFIPGNFEGNISCQGSEPIGVAIYVRPLTVYGEDMILSCGELKTARLFTNFSNNDEVSYSWSPQTGLSDPSIADPLIHGEGDIHYIVSIQTSKGCEMTADVYITIKRMESPEICIISVDTTNKNILYWSKPVSQGIDSFYIYREENVTDQYEKIGSVDYDDYGVFRDTTSFPDVHSNKYKISIKDVCGLESELGSPHKTMHLSINAGINDSWNLIWEPYEGFVVSTYNVYRGSNSKDLELIGTTSGSSTQYSDLEPPNDNVYYQVEVISPNTCDIDLPEEMNSYIPKRAMVNSTRSNIVSKLLVVTSSPDIALPYSIYPNPSDGWLLIEIPQAFATGSVVEIYNLDGQLQFKTSIDSSRKEIRIDSLESGNYILKINSPAGSKSYKIFKK